MKKITALSIILTFHLSVFSQGNYSDDFDTLMTLPFRIDTAMAGNIWQVGHPQKIIFDSSFSATNAVVTDTINPYPINNRSSFIITVRDTMVFNFWNYVYLFLGFEHKYDTDTLHDGGFIELSLDGVMWQNIISFPFLQFYSNAYSSADTIEGGIPAFSGSSNGWQQTQYDFSFCGMPPSIDSLLFRFTFKSDSINNNREGWMVDDINIYAGVCEGVAEKEKDKISISIFPNPATNQFTISSKPWAIKEIEIYNVVGEKIKALTPNSSLLGEGRTSQHATAHGSQQWQAGIDVSELTPGIYFVRVMGEKTFAVRKFVKE